MPEDLLPPTFSRQTTRAPKQAFSVRRIVWLALARPEKRTQEQTQEVTRASLLHPEVTTALTLAQSFVKMMQERNVKELPAWLASAQSSSLQEFRQFAHGLERDRGAVEAALCRSERNGQTEGQITRLKSMKRSMYGRGSFVLLRQRVLKRSG